MNMFDGGEVEISLSKYFFEVSIVRAEDVQRLPNSGIQISC